MRRFILLVISFFYRPFAKVMPFQTFRYLACGGGNTVLDICLYYISYHYILGGGNDLIPPPDVVLPFITIQAHIAALFMALAVTFPTGFLLSKYIVFSESNLRGRVQLIRYFMMVGTCLLLNYGFMKLFVDYLHFYPTPSKILTTCFVVIFSYLAQKRFTFKVKVAEQK
ncbi:GtrA family protein [Chitinophaga sancti]|uniref:GtrA family protein n=1 Tax=Chitinophaga sancti TaxID=1004 RepID=UPI002A74DCE6|nr:GtrA family protein [Chitinophaga sancti]WPQ64965.1 GtrA family protein [Chitinophaga sancti]